MTQISGRKTWRKPSGLLLARHTSSKPVCPVYSQSEIFVAGT